MATKTCRSPLAPSLPLTVDYNWHLARRASHGPTLALVKEIRSMGRTKWIDRQLKPASIPDVTCDALLRKIPAHSATGHETITKWWPEGDGWKNTTITARAARVRQLTSNRVLLEMMVEFWHDVLHVNGNSDTTQYVMSDFDTRVIRKHALGKFTDLLHGTTTHAAMLDYLDNTTSTKEAPNENLGRELLELHTLGVGNFTEADVKAMSQLLTGWTIDWQRYEARYEPSRHHVGAVTIAGKRVANASPGAGPTDLKVILRHLALHPATARTLCTRLARRFVRDDPPKTLVDQMVGAYLAGGSSIAPVVRLMLRSWHFNNSIGHKWSRPQEYLTKMTRVGRPKVTIYPKWREEAWKVLSTDGWLLSGAGHHPFDWGPPDGYPDVAPAWMHTNAMLSAFNCAEAVTAEWSQDLAYRHWGTSVGVWSSMTATTAASALVQNLTGFTPNKVTRDGLASLLWYGKSWGTPPKKPLGKQRLEWYLQDATRIVMASPYFLLR